MGNRQSSKSVGVIAPDEEGDLPSDDLLHATRSAKEDTHVQAHCHSGWPWPMATTPPTGTTSAKHSTATLVALEWVRTPEASAPAPQQKPSRPAAMDVAIVLLGNLPTNATTPTGEEIGQT